jgi:hypothetical protein
MADIWRITFRQIAAAHFVYTVAIMDTGVNTLTDGRPPVALSSTGS